MILCGLVHMEVGMELGLELMGLELELGLELIPDIMVSSFFSGLRLSVVLASSVQALPGPHLVEHWLPM